MRMISKGSGALVLFAVATLPISGSLAAQQPNSHDPSIVVTGDRMTAGPEIKGVISARNGDKVKVTAADGTSKQAMVWLRARSLSRTTILKLRQ
jgi:OOP family OmpA-OmpF porin